MLCNDLQAYGPMETIRTRPVGNCMRARKESRARSVGDPLRPRLIILTAIAGLLATAAVLMFPAVRFSFRSPPFHVSLETAAALTAALAAFLFFGRLREHRLQSNWALVYALLVSALANLALSVVPLMIVNVPGLGRFSVWSSIIGRLLSAGAFAFAALAPSSWETRGRFVGASIVGAAMGTVAAVALATWALLPVLPQVLVRTPGLLENDLQAAPAIIALQILSLTLFTLAAFGFIRRSDRTGDELMRWLAAGSILAAFSRLHYLLYPSLYSGWVYSGDFLRLGFYALLLVGAVREIRRYWQDMARGAALEERRRIARDLHDGLAQELAYIATQTRWLRAHDGDGETSRALNAAADRALDESRRAIAALTRDVDEPLDIALAQAAEEVADRVGTEIRLELEPGANVDAHTREGLIRIAREAIANAGRHSNAEEVLVRLSVNGQIRLEVADDGVGFVPDDVRPDRFGLVSMRERAESLNAEFLVTSSPGRGTSVEVALP